MLEPACEIKQFDMDTKRRKSKQDIQQSASEAVKLVEQWKPDVVIVADDNAAKYVLEPHFKDADIPFVFCGINWSAQEYGLPYKNATGMIEIAPVKELLVHALQIVTGGEQAVYLGADTLTETKNFQRFEQVAKSLGITVTAKLVSSSDEWIEQYQAAQDSDFIIMGSHVGIENWDAATVKTAIEPITQILSVTNHEWMMPYTIFGMTKIPQEHGEWAGSLAIEILKGASVQDFPVVANRLWDIWTNPSLMAVSRHTLPEQLLDEALSYSDSP